MSTFQTKIPKVDFQSSEHLVNETRSADLVQKTIEKRPQRSKTGGTAFLRTRETNDFQTENVEKQTNERKMKTLVHLLLLRGGLTKVLRQGFEIRGSK